MTATTAPTAERARSARRRADLTVWLIVAASAVGGVLATTTLTGWAPLDACYRAAYAAGVSLVAASARRWSWLVLAGVAAAGAIQQDWFLIPALVALALSVAAAVSNRRHRRTGALIGALSAQVLLHIGDLGPTGLPTVLALLAPLPCAVSAWRLQDQPTSKRLRTIVSWSALGLLVLSLGGLVSLAQALPEATRGGERVRAGVAALNSGDPEEAQRQLEMAAAAFKRSRDAAGSPFASVSRVLPLANAHLDAVTEVADVGHELTTVAAQAAEETDYGSIGVTDGRIDLARFADLEPPLRRVEAALATASDTLDGIDTGMLVVPAADAVEQLHRRVDDALPTARHAITGTQLAPGMLGATGERRWLVGFTSPAEARGLGGFLGYYSELTANDGRLEITDSGRVTDLAELNAGNRTLVASDEYVQRYGRLHPEEMLQDVTFSPDFPSVAQVFESQYQQATGRSVDGMILLDPIALAELLRITGPITVDGVELNHENAAEFLLQTQYAEYDDRNERGDVLDQVAREAFDRLLDNRLRDPARLLRVMAPMAAQRRVIVHSIRPDEQALFEAIGLAGTFPPAEPGLDLLAVINQNAGNNKLDAYLHRDIRYEPTIDPSTGDVTARVTVTMRNDAKVADLPKYVTRNRPDANQPAGVNWTWLSVHTPFQLTSATVEGAPAAVEPQREFGWNVYALNVAVPSDGGTATVVFELAGALDLTGGYRFRYQTQPLVHPDELLVAPTATPPWSLSAPSEAVQTAVEPLELEWTFAPG